MTQPENVFIAAQHRALDDLTSEIYYEKTNNPYRGGTPDCYYEHRRNLWIEYKFVILPKRADTLIACDTSELQRLWLRRCYENGHEPLVITGCKVPGRAQSMGVVYESPREWEHGLPCEAFMERLLPLDALATFIYARVS